MKAFILSLISCLFVLFTFAQTKSDLCLRVDSLITNVLHFVPGKPKPVVPVPNPRVDTFVTYATSQAAVTIPDYPLVVINKKLVDYKILNNYQLKDVKNINVLGRDASIEAYGPQGLHGTIVIIVNKKKNTTE